MRDHTLRSLILAGLCVCGLQAMPLWAGTLYVDAAATGSNDGSSWQNACKYLQDALAAAKAAAKPVEVRVAKGIYKPDQGAGITLGDQSATFRLLNGVTLKGGYAGAAGLDPNARDIARHETILSGDLAGNDGATAATNEENSHHVVTGSGTDNTAVIDGFTIIASSTYPPLPMPDGPRHTWAAMLINAGSPTILNCCFRDSSPWAGDALFIWNGSNPIVTNCTFLNNCGRAMDSRFNANPIVTHCRFEGNAEGIFSMQSSPVITDCRFLDNAGTALNATSGNLVVTDCTFTGGNRAGGKGINCSSAPLTLTGCTFTGLRNGAVFVSSEKELTLVRCLFRDNRGDLAGAVCNFRRSRLTALECIFVGNEGSEAGAIFSGHMELHDCEFTGNRGPQAGAIHCGAGGEQFVATGCLFAGNSSQSGVSAIFGYPEVFKLSNCTFVGNRSPCGTLDCVSAGAAVQVTQCILWDGSQLFRSHSSKPLQVGVTYSDVLGGYPGEGNIDVDPCFVDPGHWSDPNDPNAVWITGDYHLKSQAGHWDRTSQSWVCDEVTSRCIDAGDPNAPLGTEPFPNGGFLNLGAYAGTAEASKSYFGKPVCESQLAGDINGDCIVDQADLDILQLHWLMEGTGRVNSPPTMTLMSPKDGDVLTFPAPILFRCEASDSDGTVVRVRYAFHYPISDTADTTTLLVTDPQDGWDAQCPWSLVHYDGEYTVWVEVMDNQGARTASPKIRITLHPRK
jgi:hypothetical protein